MNKFSTPVMFQGVHASPYTRKALGVLRYRRIPYRFIIGQPGVITESGHIDAASLPAAKPSLLPTFYTQGDKSLQAVTDTTPILEQLDADFSGRSVHPSEPVLNLINYICHKFLTIMLSKSIKHIIFLSYYFSK